MNRLIPGFLLCAGIAAAAYVLGRLVPIVGGPVFAIVIGAAVASVRKPDVRFVPGIKFGARSVLQIAIVVLGLTLQLREVVAVGGHSLPVMIGSAVITLAAAYIFGKMLGTDRDLRRLLGVGTTICGGSAIAALASVIDVDETDLAYAISTVFAFNIVAVLIFPWIGRALALSPHAFGLWAGTAVNDTSSVVAAGFSYDKIAGNYAVIVKLTRTLLIVPLVLFYAGKRVWSHRSAEAGKPVPWRSIVPWFILWFVLAVALNSIVPIPDSAHGAISQIALLLIIFALAGVGLSVDAKAMRAAGFRPLLLGLLLWTTIALSSLGLARLAGIG